MNKKLYTACGAMTMQPFAAVGFVMARDAAGNPTPVDVSDWNGVCISYTSDVAASLVLDLGDSLGALFDDGFAFPVASLPKAVNPVTKCFNWSYFKIPSWKKENPDGWGQNTGLRAATQLVGLMFRIQNEPGQYKFNKFCGLQLKIRTELKHHFMLKTFGRKMPWRMAVGIGLRTKM